MIAAAVVRLGRDPACELSFDAAVYPKVSGEHARIERTAAALVLTPRSQSNKTLLNDQPISQPAALKVGDRVRLGFTGPTIEIVSVDGPRSKGTDSLGGPQRNRGANAPSEAGSLDEAYGATVQAEARHLNLLRGSLAAERFEIGDGGIIGRERGAVHFLLEHSHVSRRHARLKVDDEGVVLTDFGSANGTRVNGRLIAGPTLLKPGARIDVGPFSLRFDGEALVSRSRSNNIELVCRKLKRVVKDRATGKPLTLLHDINLVIRPREFVCLLGPSGSGKSTLLTLLSGRNAPDGGSVTINGEDLHDNFEALKRDIAVVPQKDILHDSLALGTALRYTAELRLPADTLREEVDSSVSSILDVVG
jgi:pSer/pThr/pTyr-binding forkhead associated (FHA) protein